ncbi:MAG: peroxiredoxin [Prolixibacteraceae bacterium]
MKAVAIGDKAPVFQLNNQYGERYDIESVLGKKKLVIYFYPKDETLGCTAEACSFRDAYSKFAALNCEIIGISSDDEESHRKFAIKHRLGFILLSDPGNRVRKRFGVPTSFFGLLPGRVTYVIDENGIVQSIFNSQLFATKHISEALKLVEKLS